MSSQCKPSEKQRLKTKLYIQCMDFKFSSVISFTEV